jgi:pimeloyl-ACP methyl ester carboxylesterase
MVKVARTIPSVRAQLAAMIGENRTIFRMQFWPSEKLDPPAAGRLKEVAVPTMVIAGEGDTDFVKRAAAAVADGIPGAELVLIAGADHLPQMEKPLEVNRHLRRLLQRGTGPGR